MSDFISVAVAAKLLDLTPRRVRVLAATKRFPGAIKVGRDWVIPKAAVKQFRPNPSGNPLFRKRHNKAG